ncbi:MAG TPA: NapC/NirT family cytochrome c [Chthoniobacterales bacterium]|nr:NapC/NirT family cytochrome c [Chthoniobacterales bacterium]
MSENSERSGTFRRHFHNWVSWAGAVLAASAIFAFLFLLAIDLTAGERNAYVGILAYLVAPGFFVLGLVLMGLGALLHKRAERRRGRREHHVFTIDLARPRDRRVLAFFALGSVGFLFLTALGSYETYHYMETVEFCGQRCHVPMEPQFVAAQHTAHAKVLCVECHVGPGATAYMKTKLNGVKQLYHAVKGDFDRPIFVSEANPRPAQQICTQCHWPEKFVGTVERTYHHFLSDETNTPFTVRLLLNVGGGDPTHGPVGGIHWHMNIANKVEYIASDEHLTKIPWVRVTNAQGLTTEYRSPEFKDDPARHKIRTMDCMDCHSRPAHKVQSPNDAVDIAMANGRIDRTIPNAKAKLVEALTQPYGTKPEALQAIATSLGQAYPDPAQANPLIQQAQAIYRRNFFPEMKMDWRTHPDQISHKDWDGCFRCHDGKHKTTDGQKTIAASDCRSCHIILAQGSGDQLKQLNADGHAFIHVDSEFSDFSCAECHTGGVQK